MHSQKPRTSKLGLMDYSYSKRSLTNGLKVVEVLQPHLHSSSIAVFFGAGSRYESPEENGLSHFLEHMIFRGTKRHRNAFDFNLAVERLGGTLFAATAPDSTVFQLTLPGENLSSGACLLAEAVTCPIFQNIDIERRVILEEIKEELDEGENQIDIDFLSRQRLWPGHPLGQSVLGSLDNARKFDVKDLFGHLSAYYVAERAVLCLSGAFDADSLALTVEREFSALTKGDLGIVRREYSTPPVLGQGPTFHHALRPGSQTQIRMAFHAPGVTDPDRIALAVLMGVLDDGMSTRLHRRIFDELGLAYNLGADVELYADAGALNVDVVSSHGNVVEIVKQTAKLIAELKEKPIGDDELKKAKNREIWALKCFLDDPHAMSGWYGEQELYLNPVSIEERMRAAEAIERPDVARIADRIFAPKNLHVTTVGVLDNAAQKQMERAMLLFG
jgi:predicted Zn-dependent peptidase